MTTTMIGVLSRDRTENKRMVKGRKRSFPRYLFALLDVYLAPLYSELSFIYIFICLPLPFLSAMFLLVTGCVYYMVKQH